MPTSYIKKLSKQGKGSVPSLEKKWKKAKDAAKESGKADNWGLVTHIFQNSIGAKARLKATAK